MAIKLSKIYFLALFKGIDGLHMEPLKSQLFKLTTTDPKF